MLTVNGVFRRGSAQTVVKKQIANEAAQKLARAEAELRELSEQGVSKVGESVPGELRCGAKPPVDAQEELERKNEELSTLRAKAQV